MAAWTLSATRILLLFSTVFWLSACSPPFEPIKQENIPIDVPSNGDTRTDVTALLSNAMKEIRRYLPDAYLTGLVFSGKCTDLPALRGRVILDSVEVGSALLTKFTKRVISAIGVINTDNQQMDLSIREETYVSTDPLDLSVDKIPLNQVARLALQKIDELGVLDSDCEVVVSRIGSTWDVGCGPLETFVRECRFVVDPSDGTIDDSTR